MIKFENKNNCCGCTACSSICSHNAIAMVPDSLGFLYPNVNRDLCIDCGLCDKVCQFHEEYDRYENYREPKVYTLRHKDSSQLDRSQSGGAFFAIAEYFIYNGGVVYGVAFTDDWRVTHQRASDMETLQKLRMSKYIQSDMRGVLPKIKEDLKIGISVLFSGTACQVASLRSYIPKRLQDNLVCIDIVCHGVPSPKIWEDYIRHLQAKQNLKIVKACFRDKRFGWKGARQTFSFENGSEVISRTTNHLYFSGLSVRESCAKCLFTNTERVGDITLGDQWNVVKTHEFKDNRGVSLLFVNSEKGDALFQKVSSSFLIEKSSIEESLQPQLLHPASLNPQRRTFVFEYEEYGFEFVAKKYSDIGWRYRKNRLIEKFKNVIRSLIRRLKNESRITHNMA